MFSLALHQTGRLGAQIRMSAVLWRDRNLTERRADNETERHKAAVLKIIGTWQKQFNMKDVDEFLTEQSNHIT